MPDFFHRLADFVTDNPVPHIDALAVMEMSLLDWIACGRAGAGEPVAIAARAAAVPVENGCAVFGSAETYPAGMAALINGATSHALDYDDTHFAHIGHPSVVIFPTVFSIGAGRPPAEILRAALIGAEVSVLVGLWLGRSHYQAGFHQTATAGAFGGVAAAAVLLGLDRHQLQQAFGLVASRAGGLKAQFGTMAKPMNAGFAAQAAVDVALLIGNGVTANPLAAETYGRLSSATMDEAALDGVGHNWLMTDVSHKFHACCHGLHAALEAFSSHPKSQIKSVVVDSHPRWASVCNQAAPETGLGAKFSFSTVMAMAADGCDTARMQSFAEPFVLSDHARSVRDIVTVRFDDSLPETAASVTTNYVDGTTKTTRHNLADPAPIATRRAKVQTKAAALLSPDQVTEIWASIVGNTTITLNA